MTKEKLPLFLVIGLGGIIYSASNKNRDYSIPDDVIESMINIDYIAEKSSSDNFENNIRKSIDENDVKRDCHTESKNGLKVFKYIPGKITYNIYEIDSLGGDLDPRLVEFIKDVVENGIDKSTSMMARYQYSIAWELLTQKRLKQLVSLLKANKEKLCRCEKILELVEKYNLEEVHQEVLSEVFE